MGRRRLSSGYPYDMSALGRLGAFETHWRWYAPLLPIRPALPAAFSRCGSPLLILRDDLCSPSSHRAGARRGHPNIPDHDSARQENQSREWALISLVSPNDLLDRLNPAEELLLDVSRLIKFEIEPV